MWYNPRPQEQLMNYEIIQDKEDQRINANDFGRIFQFISNALKPFRSYLFVLGCMVLVYTVLACFRELSVKFIIDNLAEDVNSLALIWVGILFLNDALIETSYRVTDKINYRNKPLIKQYIASLITKCMINYNYSFYQDKNPAELVSCTVNVCDGVESILTTVFDDFVRFLLLMIVTSAYALVVNAKISLLLLLWGISWMIVSIVAGAKMYGLTYQYSQSAVELEGNLTDMYQHIFTVHSLNNTKHELYNVKSWTGKVVDAENALRKMQFKLWVFQGFAFALINVLLLFYVVRLYSYGLVTIGDISLVFGLIGNLYTELWGLAKAVREFTDCIGKIGQGVQLVSVCAAQQHDQSEAKELQVTSGKVRFANVAFAYPRAHKTEDDTGMVFDGDLSFTVNSGEFVGLVGPSGSGKSTIMKLLLRMFELDGGKILIDGQDISKVGLDSLRSKIAVIPQDAGIFMQRTIAENIAYGTFDTIDEEAMEAIVTAAKQTQAHDFIMKLPEQYNTALHKYGINLSGGQKQRIAIARGFVRQASIFLFDEATSALDNITQLSVQKHIRQVIAGKTAFVIAHRLQTIKDADKVIVFDKGKIIQMGTPDMLLNQPGLFKHMWQSQ